MKDPLDRSVRAIARRDSFALIWAQFGIAHLVVFGGLALLSLYQPMHGHFWLLTAISQALVSIDNLISIKLTRRMWRPVRAWEAGERDEESTIAAWQLLATFPFDYVRRMRKYPFFIGYLPFIAFLVWDLKLPALSFLVLAAVGTSVIACGVVVRYFTMEIVARPVIEEVARYLPPEFRIERSGLSLRWRLFAAFPVINVVTALVVAGLSSRDGGAHAHHATLSSLGIQWLIAVGVSLTISLELLVLVVRALGTSMRDIGRAIAAVQEGDFSVRVPLVSTDETGVLAQSFNSMVEGLAERETLRAAFGAYVDPGLAERVLREGSDLEGEDLDVTVLFLDIRNFTSYAEEARPHEVVALLNGLWELVVPILLGHGGHANKFIGDGVLAVFGAPETLPDHASAAVAAALEISEAVQARYGDKVIVGIGVNTGRVIAGTIGGGGRVEFTVIGDSVNTAARVEAATRETGDPVLITDATRMRLPPDHFELERRDEVELRGKQVPVQLWAVRAARRPESFTDERQPEIQAWSTRGAAGQATARAGD
jgi:adenylate cyclase